MHRSETVFPTVSSLDAMLLRPSIDSATHRDVHETTAFFAFYSQKQTYPALDGSFGHVAERREVHGWTKQRSIERRNSPDGYFGAVNETTI